MSSKPANPPTTLTTKERVARNVRGLRGRLNLSQEALAERSGVSRPTIRRIEAGDASYLVDQLDPIARALGVDVTELTGE